MNGGGSLAIEAPGWVLLRQFGGDAQRDGFGWRTIVKYTFLLTLTGGCCMLDKKNPSASKLHRLFSIVGVAVHLKVEEILTLLLFVAEKVPNTGRKKVGRNGRGASLPSTYTSKLSTELYY